MGLRHSRHCWNINRKLNWTSRRERTISVATLVENSDTVRECVRYAKQQHDRNERRANDTVTWRNWNHLHQQLWRFSEICVSMWFYATKGIAKVCTGCSKLAVNQASNYCSSHPYIFCHNQCYSHYHAFINCFTRTHCKLRTQCCIRLQFNRMMVAS